jgi:hypothetical protein
MVESFTSYITRLSRAHFLPPWVLVTRDIAPRYRSVKVAQDGHCDLFGQLGAALNGNRNTAIEGVGIVEGLTFRKGLESLTLRSLSSSISPAALLHPFEAWCPACLEDWKKAGAEVYSPLLWQVRAASGVIAPYPATVGQVTARGARDGLAPADQRPTPVDQEERRSSSLDSWPVKSCT